MTRFKTAYQRMRQLLRPFDYVVIGLIIALSFVPHVIFAYQHAQMPEGTERIAIVKIRGEIVDRFSLEEDLHIEKTYHPSKSQWNTIQIDGNRARVKEDNSPHQIAVKTGWIDRPGQVALCLPHDLILIIEGQAEAEADELITPL
ncbi:NusG domain II-containing protein [Atopobacter phocae]|uniref:NusG domain II-containing protein n=1 Tax=Atopobacter phocae TaxID=136492 RepID=UPI0004721E17|nr:NusG domain II-containing protein [Atopobacter phocae]